MARAKRATGAAAKQDRDGLSLRAGSKFYWMCYVDETGETVRKSTKETDRKQALQVRAEAIRRVSLIRQGLIDPVAERRKAKQAEPIAPKVDAYLRSLEADGTCAKHLAGRRQNITAVVDATGWSTLAEIEPKALAAFLVDLRGRPSSHAGHRLSDRTIRGYGESMRNFVRWLVSEAHLSKDPLVSVKLPSARTRHRRRMLLPDEYLPLAEATLNGPVRCRLTGTERLLLYRTAILTGFRASELAALTFGSLRRIGDGFVLFLDGIHTKNGKDARIDIPADLAHDLKESFRAANPPRQSLLRMPLHLESLANMLREDLAAAREAWVAASTSGRELAEREGSDFLRSVNAAGEKLVMHGLRHTSGAWQVLAGVPLPVVKERMRHGTITLTLDVYGHLAPGQERAACDTLAASIPSVQKPSAAPSGKCLPESDFPPLGAVQKMYSKGRRNGPQGTENLPSDAGGSEDGQSEKSLETQAFPCFAGADDGLPAEALHLRGARLR